MGYSCGLNTLYSSISSRSRYAAILESDSHHFLGFEPIWNLLHSGGSRALLHRRLHRLLHHHSPLPLLSHFSQHACLPTEPEGTHLVPNVLFLWVQCEWACSQPVSLALWKTRFHENSDRIEFLTRDQRRSHAQTIDDRCYFMYCLNIGFISNYI